MAGRLSTKQIIFSQMFVRGRAFGIDPHPLELGPFPKRWNDVWEATTNGLSVLRPVDARVEYALSCL
jgi:hypothetical protein